MSSNKGVHGKATKGIRFACARIAENRPTSIDPQTGRDRKKWFTVT
jgi:hypothetical protein